MMHFAGGLVTGVFAGFYTPEDYEFPVAAGSLAAYGADTILVVAWKRIASTVPGPVQLSWAFAVGFNTGYFAVEGVEYLAAGEEDPS